MGLQWVLPMKMKRRQQGRRSSWRVLQVGLQHIAGLRAEFEVNLSVSWTTTKMRRAYL